MGLLKNKRGMSEEGFENIVYGIAFIFFAAILFFVVFFIYGQVKTPVADALTGALPNGASETAFNMSSFSEQTSGGLGIYNNLFPFLMVGVIIMVGISLFYIKSHPGFFFISIIIFGIIILLSGIFSNVYQAVSTNEAFGTTSTNFNIQEFIFKYFPLVTLIIIAIGVIFMYAKPSGGSNGGL